MNPFMNTTFMAEREAFERPERARQLAERDALPDPLLVKLGAWVKGRLTLVFSAVLGLLLSSFRRKG